MKFELNLVALLALASSAIAVPMKVGARQSNTTATDATDGGGPAKFLSYSDYLGYGVYDAYGTYLGYGVYDAYGTYLGYATYTQTVEEAAKAKAAREANPDALPHTPWVKREPAREQDFGSYKDYGSYGTYEDYKKE